MKNLQNNPWVLLIISLVLGGVVVWAGYEYWPNITQMESDRNTLIDQVTTLQKEVQEGRALQARLPELQREIKAKEDELEQLKKILPPDSYIEDLVRRVEEQAVAARLRIEMFSPQRRIPKEFYYELPINIHAFGSYHNLAGFYAKLGNFARIINVSQVRISQVQSSATSSDLTIDANFLATTYVYKEDDAK